MGAPSNPSCVDSRDSSLNILLPLAPLDAGLRVGDRATHKRCFRHTKDALSTRKNRKNRRKKIEKSRKNRKNLLLPSGRGENTRRWVASLTPPYLRQIRRGLVHHAFHKKHPLRSM